MQQSRGMSRAADAALRCMRGDLETLQRLVMALRNSMDQEAAAEGQDGVMTGPIRDRPENSKSGRSWDEIRQELRGESWFPQFGALLPPDERE